MPTILESQVAVMIANQEKMEAHLRSYRENQVIQNSNIKEIKDALVGSNLTGNKGLVNEVLDLEKKIESQNEKLIQYDVYVNQAKWAFGILASIIVALFVAVIKGIK